MDEEDLGKTIAGVNLVTKNSYDTFGAREKNYHKQQVGSSNILGEAFDEFFVESKDSIGHNIIANLYENLSEVKNSEIKKYGLIQPKSTKEICDSEKEESLLGKRDFYKPALPPNHSNNSKKDIGEIKDTYMNLSRIKDFKGDFTGLGFTGQSGTQYLNYEDELEDNFNNIIKEYLNKKEDTLIDNTNPNNPTNKPSRVYMDLFDSNMTDYTNSHTKNEHYSRYEVSLEDDLQNPNKKSQNSENLKMKNFKRNIRSHFVKCQDPYMLELSYSEIEIPKDYQPFCKFLKKSVNTQIDHYSKYQQQRQMNSDSRAKLLGEEEKIGVPEDFTNEQKADEKKQYTRENALDYFTQTKPLASG